ncbi:MAG: alpha/beta fold hydrolase [Chloroflexaceae bacterium]|jgi:pimeloyl-ACP methyl ester carboxylesterase|nr:alpha/beta fold hydrolase [Chloroflexaceae bacterium]
MTIETRYSITERYTEGPYGPVRYWESEPKQGLPVVLVHGYGALIEHWRRVMRPIASVHSLYAIDLYNFGYSARLKVPPSKDIWAQQLASFVEKVIGQPAVIVGHSMGGMAAIQCAANHPQWVKGLVSVCNSGILNPERPPSDLDMFLFQATSAPLVGELIAALAANELAVRQGLNAAYFRKERVTPELVEAFVGPIRRYGTGSYLAVTRSFNNLVLDVPAGRITAPALLIWGAEDRSIPPTIAPLVQQRILPQAPLEIIPQSGHCPFDETPDEFCNILLPWLANLS